MTETPWLPSVVEALPVLDTGAGVYAADEPIALTLRSTKRRACIIRVVCRGELVGIKTTEIGIGDTELSIPIQDRAAGVIRVTVLDAEGETATPLVERLVYRRNAKRLRISANVDDDRRVHSPGDSVRMTLKVTDEFDQPVPAAVLGVSVVDDAALSLRHDELPSIRTHFLLTSEIASPEDLEHANFYLNDTPEAAESLDLLLGTQGWRRFVSGTPDQFEESFLESLTRLLELDGRRAGLIGQARTNETNIADQLRDYQLRAAAAWQAFVSEIRFVLILIGVVWLIGLVIRPRKSTVAAAGLLLLAAVMFSQAGCGGSYENRVVEPTAPSQAYSDEMMDSSEKAKRAFGQEEMEMEDFGSMAPADEDLSSAKNEKPFVERVVRVFLGQRGTKVKTDVSQSQLTPDQLRRWAESRDVDAQALADKLMEELRFPIRQYAHLHRPSDNQVRSDFAETLFWNPMMVTDSAGTATIRFDLSDSLTMFRVHVDGHSSDGRLGSGGGSVLTEIPIQVEPKVPLEVTGGDRIDLPVGLVNATGESGALNVEIETGDALDAKRLSSTTPVGAGGRVTEVFPVDVAVAKQTTEAKIRVSATLSGGTLSDQVERLIRIVPSGFPFEVSQSGSLSETATITPRLPESIVPGSLSGQLQFYPSTRSQLSAGLESILKRTARVF